MRENRASRLHGRMKNSFYYIIAPVGVRTHDLPHTAASNMAKVSQASNHSATAAVRGLKIIASNLVIRTMKQMSCPMFGFDV